MTTLKQFLAEAMTKHQEMLHGLSNSDNFYVRMDVAENHNTHPDTLRHMAPRAGLAARIRIAKHPNCPPDVLHTFADSDGQDSLDSEVAHAVAYNNNTSGETLHLLSRHHADHIRGGVARNPNTRTDTLIHLAHRDNEPSPTIRNDAALSLAIRGRVVNPNTDEVSVASWAKKRVDESTMTKHQEMLHHMAVADYGADVDVEIALNRATHPDTLHHLCKHYPDEIAENPSASGKTLHNIARMHEPDPYSNYVFARHHAVIEHPNVWKRTLVHYVRRNILANKARSKLYEKGYLMIKASDAADGKEKIWKRKDDE